MVESVVPAKVKTNKKIAVSLNLPSRRKTLITPLSRAVHFGINLSAVYYCRYREVIIKVTSDEVRPSLSEAAQDVQDEANDPVVCPLVTCYQKVSPKRDIQ